MIVWISEKCTECLIFHGIIPKSDAVFYAFGLRQCLRMFLNILTTIIIGYMMGMTLQSLLFLLAFIPMRSYTGGFHAKTPLRCYAYSILIIIVSLRGISILRSYQLMGMILAGASFLIIFFLSPIESKNKHLSQEEIECYHKKTLIYLIVLLISIILMRTVSVEFSHCLCMVLIIVAILLLLGIIQ